MEERLCRGANFTHDSHRELRKLEQEMGAPDTRTAKIEEILDTARQTPLGVTPTKKGSPPWVRHHPKDTTSLCRLFMQDPAGPGADGLGAVMYRYLSATPHGTLHGLLRSSQPVPGVVASKSGTLRSLELNPHEVAMLIAGVMVAYIFATDLQMLYFGWSGPAWDGWKLAVRDLIRPYLPDTPF